ncbi:MAG: alpha/beta fold hydrolase [Xanthobacteraceae bacterium]|nr:alpha/beta fold hydrolase [Xanthobacteraceae bacterium]MBX9826912.1 alpha/beta fold hydrolase [Xanthobacteraceae bacterium]
MPAERFDFPNAKGEKLAAVLDLPDGAPRAYALFAHCFTCGKNVVAAKRIADALTALGIAVLRFDFTGIGSSEGEFSNTTFSSNVDDLVAAADHLRKMRQAPALLIGHSLGGAAVLAAASSIAEARAVVTIAAPFDPAHVAHLFKDKLDAIGTDGEVEVALAGRPFRIRREFLDDVAQHKLTDHIGKLHKALLIFHAPTDDTVGIENASQIFAAAKHPKSFISLAGADHLLTMRSDAVYVANVLAAWAERYIDVAPMTAASEAPLRAVVVTETGGGKFQQSVVIGRHRLTADEPLAAGGLDSGPGPYDLLLSALGACTSMTMRLYADHKKLPLERVSVTLSYAKIHAQDCEECETKEGKIDRIDRLITMTGDLSDEQRARLLEIADKCPVHRTLHSEVNIRTTEGRPD